MMAQAWQVYGETAVIIQRLTETLDDGVLTAVSVQAILEG